MKDYTNITFILDRSGSMQSVADDTIGGFNSFIEKQKEVPSSTLSLIQFDDRYDIVYMNKPVKDAPSLTKETFEPRGSTALLDAIGRTIDRLGADFKAMTDAEKPSRVVVVILTDGYENASREFTADKINEMISHQRDVYKWEFVFLGANQDAIATASHLGMSTSNAMTYTSSGRGIKGAINAVATNVAQYSSGATMDCMFLDEQKEEQKKLAQGQS